MRYSSLASAVLIAATAAPALALPIAARTVEDSSLVEREYYDDLVARDMLEARRQPAPRPRTPTPPPPPRPHTPPSPPPPPPNSPARRSEIDLEELFARGWEYDDLVAREMLEARRQPAPRPRTPTPPPPPRPHTPPSPPPPPPNSPARRSDSMLEARRQPAPRPRTPTPPPPPRPHTPPSPPPPPPNSPARRSEIDLEELFARGWEYDDLVARDILEARRQPAPRPRTPTPPPPPRPHTPPSPPPPPPNSPARRSEIDELFARGWEFDELD